MSALVYFLIGCVVAVILFHTALQTTRKRWSAFAPLNYFWGGVLVVYVLQPLRHGTQYANWHSTAVYEETCMLILLSVCAVIFGYELFPQRWKFSFLPTLPVTLRSTPLLGAAYLLIALGMMAYVYQFRSGGGLEQWAAAGRGGTDWQNVNIFVAQLADFVPLGVSLLLFEANLHRRSSAHQTIAWTAGGLMLLWFIYLGSRSRMIVFACAMLAIYYVSRKRNPNLIAASIVGLFLLTATEFVGAFRDRFTNLSFDVQSDDIATAFRRAMPGSDSGDRDAALAAGIGAEFNCVLTVVELVPNQVPYDGGYALGELITRFIPRVLWAEKRYPHYEAFTKILIAGQIPGVQFETEQGPLLAGPAFTFTGHWYAIGGIPALLLMGIITGGFFRRLEHLYHPGGSESLTILYITFGPIAFFEAVATPLFFVFNLPYNLIPLLAIFWLCGNKERQQVPAGQWVQPLNYQPGRWS